MLKDISALIIIFWTCTFSWSKLYDGWSVVILRSTEHQPRLLWSQIKKAKNVASYRRSIEALSIESSESRPYSIKPLVNRTSFSRNCRELHDSAWSTDYRPRTWSQFWAFVMYLFLVVLGHIPSSSQHTRCTTTTRSSKVHTRGFESSFNKCTTHSHSHPKHNIYMQYIYDEHTWSSIHNILQTTYACYLHNPNNII